MEQAKYWLTAAWPLSLSLLLHVGIVLSRGRQARSLAYGLPCADITKTRRGGKEEVEETRGGVPAVAIVCFFLQKRAVHEETKQKG